MSNQFVTVEDTFDAAHTLPSHGPWKHGHGYRVAVTVNDVDTFSLPEALHDIVGELHLRDLDEMLTGSKEQSNLTTIAAWIMERLTLRFQRISRVEVWENEKTHGGVTRELR